MLLSHVYFIMYTATAYFISLEHVKVKVKFTLEQATKAQKWNRCIVLLFL